MEWLAGDARASYADLCLKAALETATFESFRRHASYTPILEHVNAETGRQYLKIILDGGYSLDEVLEIIEPLQRLGGPILYDVGAGRPLSATALRYLKVGIDIIAQLGKNLGNVIEIGCGYGGQAIILSRICSIQHYTFLDMWQANLLIQRFIEESNFHVDYDIKTIRQSPGSLSADLIVSNYAFSELDMQLQSLCLKKFILSSKHGYLTMNTGLDGTAFNAQAARHIASDVLVSLIPNAQLAPEVPRTSPSNYIIYW